VADNEEISLNGTLTFIFISVKCIVMFAFCRNEGNKRERVWDFRVKFDFMGLSLF
jgi:hypothetical protein